MIPLDESAEARDIDEIRSDRPILARHDARASRRVAAPRRGRGRRPRPAAARPGAGAGAGGRALAGGLIEPTDDGRARARV